MVFPKIGSKVSVEFSLRQRPPINFNVMLQSHALQHGLGTSSIQFHPHPVSSTIVLHLSGMDIEKSRRFAESAKGRYSTYIREATIRFENKAFKV